jgi:hypothetical protein
MQIERGEFEAALETLRAMEEDYGRTGNSLRIGMKGYIEYLFAYAAFAIGDHGTSLAWLGRILNARGRGLAIDVQCYARLLNLIVHYELDNLELLVYLIPSVKRYLKARNRLFAFERCLLQLVGRLAVASGQADKRDILSQARDEARRFRNDRFESQAFSHFDLLAWIDAKLEDLCYIESIRRRRADLFPEDLRLANVVACSGVAPVQGA